MKYLPVISLRLYLNILSNCKYLDIFFVERVDSRIFLL